jgi:hypothetical protein
VGNVKVIHFVPSAAQKGTVQEDDLQSLGLYKVRKYNSSLVERIGRSKSRSKKKSDPKQVVVKRARAHLSGKDYHLFSHNCETFAIYCKTGKGFEKDRLNSRAFVFLGIIAVAATVVWKM